MTYTELYKQEIKNKVASDEQIYKVASLTKQALKINSQQARIAGKALLQGASKALKPGKEAIKAGGKVVANAARATGGAIKRSGKATLDAANTAGGAVNKGIRKGLAGAAKYEKGIKSSLNNVRDLQNRKLYEDAVRDIFTGAAKNNSRFSPVDLGQAGLLEALKGGLKNSMGTFTDNLKAALARRQALHRLNNIDQKLLGGNGAAYLNKYKNRISGLSTAGAFKGINVDKLSKDYLKRIMRNSAITGGTAGAGAVAHQLLSED